MPITVLDALVVPVRSSSILSSVAYPGMVFAASVRLSSPSCSPTSIRNTSLLTRSTRTTTALRTGHRPRRPERTSTPPAFPSSDTHTSVSMLSGVLKRARRQVATTHGAMAQTLVTALDGLSLIGILMLGTSIAQALNDYLSWTCSPGHRRVTTSTVAIHFVPIQHNLTLTLRAVSQLVQSSRWWMPMAVL
jgi:hypothetical protein